MKQKELNIPAFLDQLGFDKTNTMQEAAIDSIGRGSDVVLLSPTGSGKTLAFLMPLMTALEPSAGRIQLLILAPSRELCLQIEDVFRSLKTGLKVNAFYGGHPIKDELNSLEHPPLVLIATPGRLADHLRRDSLSLRHLKALVLDEFDKTLEYGFYNEMKEIMQKVDKKVQKVLTSATHLVDLPDFLVLKGVEELDFTDNKPVKGLRQWLVRAEGRDKLKALGDLLCSIGTQASLVFVNHREAADRISEHLRDLGIDNAVFHGGMKQEIREKELFRFRNGSCRVLVTSDLASRGLDIPVVMNVIHYQLPHKEEAYVHRNGRTARMDADGNAFVLLAEGELLRDFMATDMEELPWQETIVLPEATEWETLYVGAGKKDKINKIDLVGFFIKKGGLDKGDIGLIQVSDYAALIAIKRHKIRAVIKKVSDQRIKNKKIKMAVAR